MKPALVVIDMQTRFLRTRKTIHPDLDDAVEIINHVASTFRAAGRPVIWVQDAESMDESDPLFAMPDALDGLSFTQDSSVALSAFLPATDLGAVFDE